MANSQIKTRIIHKHDTAENWEKATNFYPQLGEIIIYDSDNNNSLPRIKIGDGEKLAKELPFLEGENEILAITNSEIDAICV